MIFHVHAYVDDHVLRTAAKTARDAFAKAIEWHVVGRLKGISISDGTGSYAITSVSINDGTKIYSIDAFALAMALLEIAKSVNAAADLEVEGK